MRMVSGPDYETRWHLVSAACHKPTATPLVAVVAELAQMCLGSCAEQRGHTQWCLGNCASKWNIYNVLSSECNMKKSSVQADSEGRRGANGKAEAEM